MKLFQKIIIYFSAKDCLHHIDLLFKNKNEKKKYK